MQVNLEKFSGPLDLLLNLIQDRELNISDISLTAVTEQYLEYLDKVEEVQPEELADFLVIASRLLLIKARALLPQLMPEEENESDLAEQLRMYRKFVDVSKKVHDLWLDPRVSYGRVEPVRIPENPEPPANVTAELLEQYMKRLVHKLTPPKQLPRTYIDKTVSLKEKVDQFRALLKNHTRFNFSDVVHSRANRTETIVGFLALLELVKQKAIEIKQDALFEDIVIERV